MPSNLPPGVTEGMLPGNRPEDAENERAWDDLHGWLDDLGIYVVVEPAYIKSLIKPWAKKQDGWRQFVISRPKQLSDHEARAITNAPRPELGAFLKASAKWMNPKRKRKYDKMKVQCQKGEK